MSENNSNAISIDQAFLVRKLGNSTLNLKNSFIKSATYEGMYDKGIPNHKLIDHHETLAKGGVGLTTVSYAAVSADARTFEDQMFINEQSLRPLEVLVKKVHAAGGKVSIQLTHCGFFSKNKKAKKILAPSKLFNAYGFLSGVGFSKAMQENDLEEVIEDFVRSALSLQSIGFDALEIHMGHGYLLSQFLSPLTNKRKDRYGGSIINRSRFPLEVIKRVFKALTNLIYQRKI
jgi:2,4-dienoyl-CoA reductase-like NADH-dependent reductase (Old Yellow Enzyme family)